MKVIGDIRQHRPGGTARMSESFSVSFVHDGLKRSGELTNLSLEGAHLQLRADDPARSELHIGKELHFNVLTPYGCSQCKAEVKWLGSEKEAMSVGVKFTSLSEDPSDPLRCAIDSPI